MTEINMRWGGRPPRQTSTESRATACYQSFALAASVCLANDNDASIYPGAAEVAYDGIDQDCNGSDLVDVDGNGYDSTAAGGADCNDNDASIHPGATEVCDGKDNDCDDQVDDGLSTDADGDWHYSPGSCAQPADDCNDSDGSVHPGASEICDGKDNDCDGQIDEGC